MSYKEDLKINVYSLEDELVKQPGLYFKYAEDLAEAERVKSKLKNKLDLLLAAKDLATAYFPLIFPQVVGSVAETSTRPGAKAGKVPPPGMSLHSMTNQWSGFSPSAGFP